MENPEPDPVARLRPVEAPDEIAQEPDAEHGQHMVYLEHQEVRRPSGFIAALFGGKNKP
jgi:hypothetical protein